MKYRIKLGLTIIHASTLGNAYAGFSEYNDGTYFIDTRETEKIVKRIATFRSESKELSPF